MSQCLKIMKHFTNDLKRVAERNEKLCHNNSFHFEGSHYFKTSHKLSESLDRNFFFHEVTTWTNIFFGCLLIQQHKLLTALSFQLFAHTFSCEMPNPDSSNICGRRPVTLAVMGLHKSDSSHHSVISVPYIHTQLCRPTEEQNTWLWCRTEWTFQKKLKGANQIGNRG